MVVLLWVKKYGDDLIQIQRGKRMNSYRTKYSQEFLPLDKEWSDMTTKNLWHVGAHDVDPPASVGCATLMVLGLRLLRLTQLVEGCLCEERSGKILWRISGVFETGLRTNSSDERFILLLKILVSRGPLKFNCSNRMAIIFVISDQQLKKVSYYWRQHGWIFASFPLNNLWFWWKSRLYLSLIFMNICQISPTRCDRTEITVKIL